MSVRYAFLPLTAGLERLDAIRQIADVREFARDAVVIREGERTFAVHIVQRGAVVARASPASLSPGSGHVLEVLAPGDAFGFEALLSANPQPRSSPEHRALVDSSVLRVDAARLWQAAARDANVARPVVAAAAAAVERRADRLAEALDGPASTRLLAALRGLAARFGRPTDGGVAIALPLRQELLAGLVGTTRETVNRSLGALERAGAIRCTRGRYVVALASDGPSASPRETAHVSSIGSVSPLSRPVASARSRVRTPSASSL